MTDDKFENWSGGYDRAQAEQVGEFWHAVKPPPLRSARHRRVHKAKLAFELLLGLAFLATILVVITEH